ncbi:MAG TPA: protein-L-isoaspartate(D-aspartate) O-methyltransferase [Rhizobiales bacterium]|nr:protein-L-isoaspartate(D-aspartate) O-methyltransferase [Hyphomicrobiales bacterium]
MTAAEDREGFAAFMLRLRATGMVTRELAAAFEATPRRAFLPGQWHSVAWSDRMIPIACGETIEGVDLQASVVRALDLQPGVRVLEIGTGSGYTAAVMSRLAGRVLTVERYKTLATQARAALEALGIQNVQVRHADGANGLPGEGPFDRIVVWAAFDNLPRAYVDQLSIGGVMIAPIGAAEAPQSLARLTKVGSRFEREDIGKVRLQPITPGVAAVI